MSKEADVVRQPPRSARHATHSPIVLAYPDSLIYQLTADGIETVPYAETESFVVTQQFLSDHERMIEILLEEHENGPSPA